MRFGRYVASTGRHIYRCSGCKWGRGYGSASEADIAQAFHACPWRGADMPAGKSIIEKSWEQLDAQLDEIIALKAKVNSLGGGDTMKVDTEGWIDQFAAARARARGKAEILALFMAPHFNTADEVSMESSRRRAARLAGDTSYVTPGLTGSTS
jgi:hypothetical protein